jgi:hypothetical protein
MDSAHITVEAYAGYKGEETPRAFTVQGVRLLVREIVGRWYTDTHSYFRISASDQHRYVLRFDLEQCRWELVMCETM